MTSTERIVEYCNLDPEPESDTKTVLSKGWPKYGIITAEGASFAHHKSLPYVLKTMFFCIRASEKVRDFAKFKKSFRGICFCVSFDQDKRRKLNLFLSCFAHMHFADE